MAKIHAQRAFFQSALPKKNDNSWNIILKIFTFFFDNESTFDRKNRSVVVNNHKIMGK